MIVRSLFKAPVQRQLDLDTAHLHCQSFGEIISSLISFIYVLIDGSLQHRISDTFLIHLIVLQYAFMAPLAKEVGPPPNVLI